MKQLIVISAPSGAGKTTIARRILAAHPEELTFSVSATTRQMRAGERDGVDYYFLTREEFVEKIKEKALIEYEEIFGNYYGTPVSEIERAKASRKRLIFDIDVKGGISIRTRFPDDALLVFIAPPSLEVLRERLRMRGSETEQTIERRLARAQMEMEMADVYDFIIVNKELETSVEEVGRIIFST